MSGSSYDAALRDASLRVARAAHQRQVEAIAEAKRAQVEEEQRALRELRAYAEARRTARRLRRRRIVQTCCLAAIALASVALLILGGVS